MASSGITSLLIVLLLAFCVSNLEAAECSRDIDCTFKCKYGGICDDTNTKKCFCWPPKVFMEDVRCINDDDCIKICTPGCKIHVCQHGLCLCQCSA
ncbi:hypothetical protein Golob_019581 [Gossypium lobatum]|uniref:Defensin-like protein 263 n=1 Tax=Gossypium lobatum TaxID=34289 RepID=A0A7J8L7T8_9ROSI|nr:hypothetical protein [Gossypium lobatum]